ncbi:hypothetical protein JHW43_008942 [Diplocarpon mali]|nr:hypothetical protein JHW43_008942 [Diplocarpon mali]
MHPIVVVVSPGGVLCPSPRREGLWSLRGDGPGRCVLRAGTRGGCWVLGRSPEASSARETIARPGSRPATRSTRQREHDRRDFGSQARRETSIVGPEGCGGTEPCASCPRSCGWYLGPLRPAGPPLISRNPRCSHLQAAARREC